MSLLESITFGSLMDAAQTVALVVLWLRKPGQDASAGVVRLDGELAVVKERMSHMPTSTDLAELEGAVQASKATLDALADSHVVVRSTLTRIEQYLLTHKTA